MKLCHVVPSLQQHHGGPSKSVLALCHALAQGGDRVELLATAPDAPRDGSIEVHGRLTVRIFRRDWPDRLVRSRGLARALQASDADIFHHHALWLRTLHYTRCAAQRRRAPLIISPRGMMSLWAWRHHRARKALAADLIHPGALRVARAWHVTSPQEADEIASLGFSQPTCLAPNGIEAPSAAALKESAEHWRKAWPEAERSRVALFYGRFHQKKRIIELIDAWLEVSPPGWLLLLVGIPEDYTPEGLEQYAYRQGCAGRIRAFDGAGRPAPYGVGSLFLHPSHNENFGMAIAEALASGVSAVVTDTTPWHGLNRENRGWCVPWADFAKTLATATSESRADLQARGARAREWALDTFSWNRAAANLKDFYRTLLAA